MKILSFQPFSLYGTGGGSRILRRLYKDKESDIHSLAVNATFSKPKSGKIDETIINAFPVAKKWMKWHLRYYAQWLRENPFKSATKRKIQKAAERIPHSIIHAVDHGPFSSALADTLSISQKNLWVSFHDHFSTSGGSFNNSEKLWNVASRRLMISNEIGQEYCRLLGNKGYEIITDGVLPSELSTPVEKFSENISVYFAGLLHIDYLPLFSALADALENLAEQGWQVKLILRGTQYIDFLRNRKFGVDYRPVSLDDNLLKEELNSATILYLPIKFTIPDFYLFSLSTKMVGYLGASRSILYHGPKDSAACKVLRDSDAAECCVSLVPNELLTSLNRLLHNRSSVSANAKVLAASRFDMLKLQKNFWQIKD